MKKIVLIISLFVATVGIYYVLSTKTSQEESPSQVTDLLNQESSLDGQLNHFLHKDMEVKKKVEKVEVVIEKKIAASEPKETMVELEPTPPKVSTPIVEPQIVAKKVEKIAQEKPVGNISKNKTFYSSTEPEESQGIILEEEKQEDEYQFNEVLGYHNHSAVLRAPLPHYDLAIALTKADVDKAVEAGELDKLAMWVERLDGGDYPKTVAYILTKIAEMQTKKK